MTSLGIRMREIAAYRLGRADRALRGRSGQVLLLAYHNIRPRGASAAGERGLHLPQGAFARQLDFLARTHQVRSLADLGEPAPGDRPTVVLTFDDGYRGALSAGVEELTRRGMPATFFVPPGRLGDHTFWWDHLAEQAGGETTDETKRHCLQTLRGEDERIRNWARDHGLEGRDGAGVRPLPSWARSVTAGELAAVAAMPGITIASHTWSHANLAALGAEEVATELRRAGEWLTGRFPRSLPWVSFPYGKPPADAEGSGTRAGYRGGVLIGDAASWIRAPVGAGGWVVAPRLNVAGDVSLERFALTMSGAW